MNNNNILGNGTVPHEFSQRHGLERLGEKPKKVADIPPIEYCNWLLHKYYTRHEYKITKNLIDVKLINSNGHNEYANYLKGLILRREGRIQDSLTCFRDSCTINCTNVQHVKQIAKSLYLLGDYKHAIDAYVQAAKISSSQDWEIHHRLGECYVALHHWEQAKVELVKATALTNDKIPHIALAQLAVLENKIDYAIEIYKHVIKCCDDSSEAIIQLGFIYLQHDDISRAFQAFGTVMAQLPINVQAILPIAYVMQIHREYSVALTKYKSVTHAFPESWQLWNNIGMCFCGKHKFVAAITCLKRAHYLNPMAWQPACNLGRVFLLTSQPASAAVYLCAAITTATTSLNHMPYLLLGLALKKLNDIEGAERALSKAHSLTPHDPIILINYAIVLQVQKQTARVAEILSDLNACVVKHDELKISEAIQKLSQQLGK